MGSVFALVACYACGELLTYNPKEMRSVQSDRGPICLWCSEEADRS